MNHKLANILKTELESLTWVDKIAGLVQTANIRIKNGDSISDKSYPISCDIDEDTCKKGAYQDLAPDSKKKSVLYFEDKGLSFDHQDGNRLFYKSSLLLVCWLNHKLIQGETCDSGVTGCGTSGDYVLEVIKAFDYKPFNSGGLYGITITPPSQEIRDVSIFSKYSYNETALQYLMFPYDYFALSLEIEFMIPCLT